MWPSNLFYKTILLLLAGSVLTGCGGGGGSSPSAPTVVVDPNLTVPLQTAMANLVNNGFSKPFTITGWIDHSTLANPNLPHTPITGSGTWSLSTPVSYTFPSTGAGWLSGTTALHSTQIVTGSTAESGITSPFSDVSAYYFSPANYTLVGKTTGGENFEYYSYNYLSNVKMGNAGLIGSSTTATILPSTTTGSYTVASDRANSLLVTFFETTISYGGGETRAQSVYRIDTLGNINLISSATNYYFLSALYQSLTYTF
jgi:hypothetical protein